MRGIPTTVVLAAVFLTSCLAAAPASAGGTGFKVVVHDANPLDTMSSAEVSKIFLKKTQFWPNGVSILPVDLSRDSEARKDFSRDVHGKSVNAIRSYWQRVVFSGDATPAPELDDDDDVLDYVSRHAGAIGYVSSGAVLGDGVHAVTIVD